MKPITIALTLSAGIVGGVFAIAERGSDNLDPKITIDPTAPARTGTLGGYAGVVEKVAPSVVSVFTTREASARGVILTADGYILTNNHVVEHADEIQVRMSDGEEHEATIGEMPDDLLTLNQPAGRPDSAKDQGALKGVKLRKLDDETRKRLGLAANTRGVLVLEVAPDSPAAAAGLRPGEVITAINHEDVTTPADAYKVAGERESATLLRVTDGKRYRFLAID